MFARIRAEQPSSVQLFGESDPIGKMVAVEGGGGQVEVELREYPGVALPFTRWCHLATDGSFEELQVSGAGNLADQDTPGSSMNITVKSGGERHRGTPGTGYRAHRRYRSADTLDRHRFVAESGRDSSMRTVSPVWASFCSS